MYGNQCLSLSYKYSHTLFHYYKNTINILIALAAQNYKQRLFDAEKFKLYEPHFPKNDQNEMIHLITKVIKLYVLIPFMYDYIFCQNSNAYELSTDKKWIPVVKIVRTQIQTKTNWGIKKNKEARRFTGTRFTWEQTSVQLFRYLIAMIYCTYIQLINYSAKGKSMTLKIKYRCSTIWIQI